MRGKPIAEISLADLNGLIEDAVPEGQHLEYKNQIPSRDGKTTGGWTPGKGVDSAGRDKLLEELVAFANADGGVIVLGMSDSNSKPHRAEALSPLAAVTELERSLRDAIVDCIEPRLPYAAVRAIPTEADGSGVILLKTEPSMLGPHWVRQTRKAAIRRQDRCDPLSMPEIHDMVLRNARRFDEVNARLTAAEQGFDASFYETLNRICKMSGSGDLKQRVRDWASSQKCSFRGIRVTLVPHQRLAIERLERVDGALLSSASVKWLCHPPRSYTLFIPFEHQGRPTLGGVEYTNFESRIALRRHRVQRDGIVELSEMSCLSEADKGVSVEWLVRATGSVLAIYDRLRDWAGAPSMPAEISVEILGLVDLKPQIGEGLNVFVGTESLGFRTLFDRCTVADPTDFDECLNMLARDLLNAGGLSTARVPRVTMAVA